MLKQSHEKLLARLKNSFVQFDTGEIPSTVPTKIQQFSSYIHDSKVFLQKLTDSSDRMSQTYKTNIDKKLALLQFTFPDYQKVCLLQNDQKRQTEGLLFMNEDFALKEVVDRYKKSNEYPSVMVVSEEIKRERRELEAFQEVVKGLRQFQAAKLKSENKVREIELKGSKINAGKQSFFSKITKQSKESQLAQNTTETQKAKQQQKMYITLTQIISNLVGLREIDRFKQLRQKAYYKMLKVFAKYEKEMALAQKDIWVKVCEHQRVAVKGEEQKKKVSSLVAEREEEKEIEKEEKKEEKEKEEGKEEIKDDEEGDK